jgi:glutathione synthase/RimK-type ligase-like ATP-grasp enzyme
VILLLSDPSDPHARQVAQLLELRGAPFVQVDHACFPAHATASLRYGADGTARRTYRADGRVIDLDAISVAWYRRPGQPTVDAAIDDPECRRYLFEESKAFVQDLWNSVGCRWVPAPVAVFRRAEMKVSQLQTAAALGFEIPPTLITNSPADFLDFYREHGGRIISKLTSAVFENQVFAGVLHRYTEIVSTRDVAYAERLQYGPMILQAYVPKRLELRITVVGRRVFAAEIHSQLTNHTRHDWRRYDLTQTPHRPHALPAAIEERCISLTERLGLCYGAIDMILTPEGRYVFVEINPNGQYLWIEQLTGLPISEAICDLLVSGEVDRQGSLRERPPARERPTCEGAAS